MSSRNSANPATAQSQNTVIPAKARISKGEPSFSAQRLLKLYDRVSDAPDAVERLRKFVLDLAVRGKLVEQDPGDEPAGTLLERVEAKKDQLVTSGKIRKPKPISPLLEDDVAFPAPRGWTWVRLAEISACLDFMRRPINGAERKRRIQGKPKDELYPYYGATQQQGWIDDYIFDEELVLLGEDGVPFFDPFRSKAYIVRGKTWVNNHAHVFKGVLVSNQYLAHYLNVFDYSGRVVGATRAKLNQARALDIPVVLPPLAEQHRIVARVNHLMALLDRLETTRTRRETTRNRLTTASLTRLTAPETTEDDFPTHSRFALDNLDQLTSRPEQINVLRQTVLNLAVRGKLVEQNPGDETAEELVVRIEAEKGPIQKTRRGSDAGRFQPDNREEEPFSLPESWVWVPTIFPTLAVPDRGKKIKTKDVLETGEFPVVDQGKVLVRGYSNDPEKVIRASQPLLIFGDHTRETKLIDFDFVVGADGVKILQPVCINPEYYYLAVQWLPLESRGYGRHFKLLRASSIPLPPLAEQHRIVAKVNDFMALLDRLESACTRRETTRGQLLESLVVAALEAG
jgi:type I restriction enzyme, S subunit